MFYHIPKTGGTTFHHMLKRVYGKRFRWVKPQRWRTRQGLSPRILAVAGHMPWGMHKRWKFDGQLVTFLRDPVERIISLWWFMRNFGQHRKHKLALKHSPGELVQTLAFAELDNGMVRWLAGRQDVGIAEIKRPVTEEDFEVALHHTHKMHVGTTATLDTDITLISGFLGWPRVPTVERQWVGEGKPTASFFCEAELDVIRQVNQWDCQLYEMMKCK